MKKIEVDIKPILEGTVIDFETTHWDAWSKKYKVKMVGAWSVSDEHVTFLVVEAPSLEAFQKLRMEPEARAVAATETVETKIVVNKEEIMKMLQKTK